MKHLKQFLALLLAVIIVLPQVEVLDVYALEAEEDVILEEEKTEDESVVYVEEETETEEEVVSEPAAADEIDGTCGDDLTWTFDEDTGVLTISGSGDMTDYDDDDAPWCEDDDTDITSVVIEEGVTSVGNYAFYSCSSIKSVTLSDSVTKIGTYAFSYCYSLTSISELSNVTSIGKAAFMRCSALESITLGSGMTEIAYYTFYECSSLTEITIPDSVVTIGESAFYYCESLVEVTIPDSVVTIDDKAFAYCTSLTSMTIPASVTAIGSQVFYCASRSSLTEINVDADNAEYASVDGVLFNADLTALIAYPAGRTDTSYEIPSTVISIYSYAFAYETNFTSITVPGNVETIGDYAFYQCSSVSSLTLEEGIKTIGVYAFAFLGWGLDTALFDIVIPEGVETIESAAFWHIYNIQSISLPESLTYIGSSAFGTDSCFQMLYTEITIPAAVTYIGFYAFVNSSLSSVTFLGDAPEISPYECLVGVTATVYYPSYASGWTSDYKEELGDSENLTFASFDEDGTITYDDATDISTLSVSLSTTSYTYSGSAKKPSVTVTDADGNVLKKGTDYTVSYADNTDVGTATVTIKGIGHYTSTVTKTFTIKQKSVSSASITLSTSSYTYNGSARKPSTTVVVSSRTLKKGTDYTVSYSDNTDAGTATVTITGTGNYKGTAQTTFTINQKSIASDSSAAQVTLSSTSYTYNGSAKKPTVTLKITLNGSTKKLTKNTDYTVSYKNNTNAGTATVTIKGTGNYKGTLTKTFTIKARSLSTYGSATLSTTTYTYNGSAKKPSVTVKATIGSSKKTLTKGTDYTVTYASGRKNCGRYKVTIKGTGNYSGTITKYFYIKPAKASTPTLSSTSSKKIKVSWTKSKGSVTGYQIYYRVKGTSTWKSVTTTSTSKTLSSLKSGKTYEIKIRAYKTISGKKYYGSWSTTKTKKCK